jgi:hypothetical protein
MRKQEHVAELVRLAVLISVETPTRRSPHSPSAYVSWDLIEQLREHTTALGYDLTGIRKSMQEIMRQNRAK